MAVLVLDLDGTLVDTLDDLADALTPVLAAHALAPSNAREVRPLIGDGISALLTRAFALRHAQAGPDDHAAYAASYDRTSGQRARFYPGVEAALADAERRGFTLAVCTNKPEAPARALLAHLGAAGRFAAICGGDSFPIRKPDPAHVTRTIDKAGGRPRDAVMVGDLHHDLAAARQAGIPSIWVSWGYGQLATASLADATADRWSDVPSLAGTLLSAPRAR